MKEDGEYPKVFYGSGEKSSAGFVDPYKISTGVWRGAQTFINPADKSKIVIGVLPGTSGQFGIGFYDPNGNLITKMVGPTRFIYNPSDSNVNVMQDGKLPDSTYGWHVAAPTKNVADGFS